MNTPVYTYAQSDDELQKIIELQKENIPTAISQEEKESQGFVTVVHSLELLKQMNSPYPHVIAKVDNLVAGYALVMLPSFRNDIPVLIPMFDLIDQLSYQNKLLKDQKYVVMGQICIDKHYRGQGLFSGLYQQLQKQLSPHFDFLITEIAAENLRSLKAHEKVGFQTIKKYHADNINWVLVLLDLKP